MMLQCEQLTAGYDKRPVLRQLDVTMEPGRLYAILGPNGCGKTTLLRTLAGLLPPLAGVVRLNGKPLAAYRHKDLAQHLAVVLTNRQISDNATGYEIVSLGRYPHTGFFGRLSRRDHAMVQQYLELCQASHLADQPLRQMSDGERQKIFLARGLAQETEILLLDEPTSHLDVHHKLELLQILRQICREQQRLVVTTLHEPELALKSCDYFLLVGQGRLQQQGDIDTLLQRDCLNGLYQLQPQQLDSSSGLVEFRHSLPVQVAFVGSDERTAVLLRRLQQLGVGYCCMAVADDAVAARVARAMGAAVSEEIDLQLLAQASIVVAYGREDLRQQVASGHWLSGYGLTAEVLTDVCRNLCRVT